MTNCHDKLCPRTTVLRSSPGPKTQEAFSFPNIALCPLQLSPPTGGKSCCPFFAKATALHFGRRKCLRGWTFYIPMTDCSPTAASQPPQHVPPAPAQRSRDGSSPSSRHGAWTCSALCRVGSLAVGNKLTFK